MPPPPPFKSPTTAALLADWPDPIIDQTFDFDSCFDWKEETSGQDAPWSISMSADAGSVTRVGIVPWRRIYACAQAALGVNWVDYSTPTKPRLRRMLPNQHPVIPWFRCVKIQSITPFDNAGATWQELAFPNDGTPPSYNYISTLPEFTPNSGGVGGGYRPAGDFGVYNFARVALEYAPIYYPLIPDTQVTDGGPMQDEKDRFIFRYADVQNIVLTIEGGNFVWYEGPDSGPYGENVPPNPKPDPDPTKNNPRPVMAKLNKIIETEGVRIVWHRVPHEWIHDLNGVLRMFGRFQGSVNKDYFFGFPPQTLRMLAPKKSPPRVEPCWVRDHANFLVGPGQSPHRLQLSYDIEILCQYFDPLPGLASHQNPDPATGNPVPVTEKTLAGHNLAVDGRDGEFYGIAHRSTKPPNVPKPFNEPLDWDFLFRHLFAKDSSGDLNL